MEASLEECADEMVEEDVYVGSEGDVEAVGDDELLDVDDAGVEYTTADGGDEVLDENSDDQVADGKDQEQEQAPDVNGEDEEKTTRRRSRSKSPSAGHEKDDFEDDELDSDVDETVAGDETDPEDEEYEMLNMPPQRAVINEVGHLKQEHRVLVRSLSLAEFNDVTMQTLLSCDSCEELKVQFVRPKNRPNDWSGFVVMNFMSSQAAQQAADEVKTIRDDLTISTEDGATFARSVVESWAKEEKGQKRWTDTLLYVRNVGENVTEDDLKQVFTEAVDVVIPKTDKARRKDSKKTKTAYVVYRTDELADAAARDYAERSVELDGHRLKVYKYRVPIDSRPASYLKLRERRVVLKYLAKLTDKIEGCTAAEQPVPDWCTKRQKWCSSLIERDDKFRHSVGLSSPSLDDIRAMKGLRGLITGTGRRGLLQRLGVVERRRPSYSYRRDGRDRDRDRGSGGYDRRRSGGGYRQPMKPSSRSLLGCPPPSLLNMPTGVMPLSLMMQQNNLALMSGLMNQGAMNWAAMGDPGSMYRGGGGGGGRSFEPSNKVLRLDSSGNYHPDYGSRDRKPSNSRDDRGPRSSSSSYKGRNDRR